MVPSVIPPVGGYFSAVPVECRDCDFPATDCTRDQPMANAGSTHSNGVASILACATVVPLLVGSGVYVSGRHGRSHHLPASVGMSWVGHGRVAGPRHHGQMTFDESGRRYDPWYHRVASAMTLVG